MKKVLVIVVVYNGMRWLERCLGSIPRWADVCVYDNDSTDGSAGFIASRFPYVQLVQSTVNIGFSHPNNLGFELARKNGYDYVYLLNQDAWLEEGALEKLADAAQAHPDFAVLSPLQMVDGYTSLDRQFAKILPAGLSLQNLSGPEPVEVRRVMAAHWLVPVRVIGQIGAFEEGLFPHWGQDDEWCQRLRYFGLKVGVVPAARAVHDRVFRKDSLEVLVKRNYYTGSLVRLCNPARPLFERFLFVMCFTVVKALKYASLLPFRYFLQVVGKLPEVRVHRAFLRKSRDFTFV